ncbi:hypothetical protein [Sphingobacterium faecale]|uniref:Restriction endonuclease type IV Mrr domain-containing protein n=1 Tax=Sphingobacterium faecale TaxID=2803775 RepID=A0ABS1R8P7_9SPHI|nr:hypothetical protein [Sphingobacterium faecale]MBL1411096.1 hypothetical protein [Sphingobacterium faecale]
MLSQEVIYQYLHEKKFGEIIMILHKHGNNLDSDTTVNFAINIFVEELFKHFEVADRISKKEIYNDLDILLLCHTEEKYLLKMDQLISLITILENRAPQKVLFKAATSYPDEPICKKIIEKFEKSEIESRTKIPASSQYLSVPGTNATEPGKKFALEVGSRDDNYWIKVFLRSNELLDVIANHLRKIASVQHVNLTQKANGHNDLTIYARRPFTINEALEEVELTLENYFSRSPMDPIFKEEVISGISEIAYFQILDYMLRLGAALEGFRELSTKMDEERYRDYFVGYLDSLSLDHTVTGETFRGLGKSDILVRNKAKEVLLVAECKLWNGKSYLDKAITQLFSRYITWRDGKAALLIFNTKATGFSQIIEISIETLKAHELFVSYEGKRSETSFSFVFRNHKDHDRLIKLELLLFNFL